MWRYHVFVRKFTWYFIGIYIIIRFIWCVVSNGVHNKKMLKSDLFKYLYTSSQQCCHTHRQLFTSYFSLDPPPSSRQEDFALSVHYLLYCLLMWYIFSVAKIPKITIIAQKRLDWSWMGRWFKIAFTWRDVFSPSLVHCAVFLCRMMKLCNALPIPV